MAAVDEEGVDFGEHEFVLRKRTKEIKRVINVQAPPPSNTGSKGRGKEKGRQGKNVKAKVKYEYGPFGQWEVDKSRLDGQDGQPIIVNFPQGGQLKIYLDRLSQEQRQRLVTELVVKSYFRVYTMQSDKEPRFQYLVHQLTGKLYAYESLDRKIKQKIRAEYNRQLRDGRLASYEPGPSSDTEPSVDSEPSDNGPEPKMPTHFVGRPTYGYKNVTMKSRSLTDKMPAMKQLFEDTENYAQEESNPITGEFFWTIGAHVVLYRNGDDSMGQHADNDQEEELILTVIVASPQTRDANGSWFEKARRVLFKSADGSEEYELWLRAGDAYSMDRKY
jgi:hypothetical protein